MVGLQEPRFASCPAAWEEGLTAHLNSDQLAAVRKVRWWWCVCVCVSRGREGDEGREGEGGKGRGGRGERTGGKESNEGREGKSVVGRGGEWRE